MLFVFLSTFSHGQVNKSSRMLETIELEKIVYKGGILSKRTIKEDIDIIVTNDDITIDGIKVGDNESVLESRFPLSTEYKNIWSGRYEDRYATCQYYYVVEISEAENVVFNVENNKIVSISINIYASN